MARYSIARRRGSFETLEPRQLLAGDVLVSVVNGSLRVEGDAEANKIMITAGAVAGEFVVTGLDTTLVGAADPITVSGVRSIRVNLGEGDDLVAIVGASVRGNVSVNAGADDDRVLVGTGEGAAELAGILPADLSVAVHGTLRIDTDGGADQISVDDAVLARLSIHAGDENDLVKLGSTAALGDLDARLAFRHGAHVSLGDGDDELQLDQVHARGGIVATGGEGADTVDSSLTTAAALVIASDGGVDDVTVVDADVHVLGIHTGDDSDSVEVRDSVFKVLGVSLGDGDDTLTTANLEARFALLAGGVGTDTLDEAVASVFGHQRIVGFEIPPDVNVNELPGRRRFGRLLHRLLS